LSESRQLPACRDNAKIAQCAAVQEREPMTQRAFYSIDETVLTAFNRQIPPARRSKVVEHLMAQHVAAADDSIAQAARMIEADPSYGDVMADAQAIGFENLLRIDADETSAHAKG
jgi:hypothetical protein